MEEDKQTVNTEKVHNFNCNDKPKYSKKSIGLIKNVCQSSTVEVFMTTEENFQEPSCVLPDTVYDLEHLSDCEKIEFGVKEDNDHQKQLEISMERREAYRPVAKPAAKQVSP